jgi:hypothetical protein
MGSSQSLGELSNLPLKGKIAFRFAKVVTLVNIELEAMDKARENVIGQYIKDREATPLVYVGKNKTERKESEVVFNNEMDELLDSTIELNTEPIDPAVLDDVDGVRPIVLSTLAWLFEE